MPACGFRARSVRKNSRTERTDRCGRFRACSVSFPNGRECSCPTPNPAILFNAVMLGEQAPERVVAYGSFCWLVPRGSGKGAERAFADPVAGESVYCNATWSHNHTGSE